MTFWMMLSMLYSASIEFSATCITMQYETMYYIGSPLYKLLVWARHFGDGSPKPHPAGGRLEPFRASIPHQRRRRYEEILQILGLPWNIWNYTRKQSSVAEPLQQKVIHKSDPLRRRPRSRPVENQIQWLRSIFLQNLYKGTLR